jgi:hypothetical protein
MYRVLYVEKSELAVMTSQVSVESDRMQTLGKDSPKSERCVGTVELYQLLNFTASNKVDE